MGGGLMLAVLPDAGFHHGATEDAVPCHAMPGAGRLLRLLPVKSPRHLQSGLRGFCAGSASAFPGQVHLCAVALP